MKGVLNQTVISQSSLFFVGDRRHGHDDGVPPRLSPRLSPGLSPPPRPSSGQEEAPGVRGLAGGHGGARRPGGGSDEASTVI